MPKVQEKNVQTQVVKDVKEIFDISYVDVEHIVKEGPARYVCAMLKIHTREGLITGCVPLPIGKAIASDNTGREMFVDLGDWNATVKLKWTPSDSMKNLPYGQSLVLLCNLYSNSFLTFFRMSSGYRSYNSTCRGQYGGIDRSSPPKKNNPCKGIQTLTK